MEQEKIFISYKRKDKELVFPLVKRIEEATGVKCWIDLEGIESQAQFESRICSAIDGSSVFLFMYSNTHRTIDLENDYTVKELNYARNYTNNNIILVNLDNTPLYNIFAFQFGSKNNIDATDSVQLDKLIRELKEKFNLSSNDDELGDGDYDTDVHYLKVKPDADCKVLIDDKEVGTAKADSITQFPLTRTGDFELACISLQTNEKLVYDVTITDGDILKKPIFNLNIGNGNTNAPEAISITTGKSSKANREIKRKWNNTPWNAPAAAPLPSNLNYMVWDIIVRHSNNNNINFATPLYDARMDKVGFAKDLKRTFNYTLIYPQYHSCQTLGVLYDMILNSLGTNSFKTNHNAASSKKDNKAIPNNIRAKRKN